MLSLVWYEVPLSVQTYGAADAVAEDGDTCWDVGDAVEEEDDDEVD